MKSFQDCPMPPSPTIQEQLINTLRRSGIALVLWLVTFTGAVQAAQPLARLDDPFSSALWAIGTDANEQVLVAALASQSYAACPLDSRPDPVVRHLFDAGFEARRARAMAVAPDGETIAYATPVATASGKAAIQLLDRRSGRVLRTFGGLPSRAQALRFSPDGAFLAAALSHGCGVRAWVVADGSPSGESMDDPAACTGALATVTPPGHANSAGNALAVLVTPNPDAWIIAAGDAGVMVYRRAGQGIERVARRSPAEVGLELPSSLALAPDMQAVAVGSRRKAGVSTNALPAVAVLSLPTLEPLGGIAVLDNAVEFPDALDPAVTPSAAQFDLARVAWARIGTASWLVAGGALPCLALRAEIITGQGAMVGRRENCALAWRTDTPAQAPRALRVGTDRIADVAALPRRGGFAFGSNRSVVGLDPAGERLLVGGSMPVAMAFDSAGVDLRQRVGDDGLPLPFDVSDDASTVHLVDYRHVEDRPLRLLFDARRLQVSAGTSAALRRVADERGLIEPRASWVNGVRPPDIRGRLATGWRVDADELHREAVVLRGNRVAVASSDHIRVVDASRDDPFVACALRVTNEALRINGSSDGKTLVVAHGDAVLRWYRVVDLARDASGRSRCSLEERLAVHLRRASSDAGSPDQLREGDWSWVAWVPETGEFASDARSRNRLRWQLTDQKCQRQLVAFGALTAELYDPEAVRTALDDGRRAAPAGTAATGPITERLAGRCVGADVTVLAPRAKTRLERPLIAVRLDVRGTEAGPVSIQATDGTGVRLPKVHAGQRLGPDVPLVVRGDGEVALQVDLTGRTPGPGADFHVCFLVGDAPTCHALTWAGEPPRPPPRRLWAVLVGVADYGGGPGAMPASLRFAHNDAIDLARLLVADHQRGGAARDYEQLSIDLFVAPAAADASPAAQELRQLATIGLVRSHPVEASGILNAIDRIEAEIKRLPPADDLFVFWFSGHGLANPTSAGKGYSLLLLPRPAAAGGSTSGLPPSLSSQQLLDAVSRLEGDRLLVFDACRNLSPDPRAAPFDAAKMRGEFETALPSAHLMFSADAGQRAVESPEHAFNAERDPARRGNGLFSYAFLRGALNQDADRIGQLHRPGRITVDEVSRHIEFFFRQWRADHPTFDPQDPVYVPAHRGRRTVLRSLDTVAAPPPTVSRRDR